MFSAIPRPLVLVVDDEPINVEILATLLRDDYQIKVASDGKTALEIAQEFPHPDLVLLDIMMPGMDGFEVCTHLKASNSTADIPVIFITAITDEPSESLGLRLGAVDYITKPFNHTITRLRVKNHLNFRHSQQALLERGAFLNTLIENAPLGVWVLSVQQEWLLQNKIAQHWLGETNKLNTLANPNLDMIDPAYHETYQQAQQDALNGKTAQLALKITTSNSAETWLELTISPLLDSQNQIIATLTLANDISQRMHNEAQLRLSAKVFENAQEGIMFTDPIGNIQDVNPAFIKITGYKREEVLGKNPKLLSSGLQSGRFYHKFWGALRKYGQWQGEIWNRRKNGELFPEWMSITAIQDSQGNLEHYLSVFTDITDAKQHELQLEKTAHYDSLTGIPNRVLLVDRLQQAIAQCNRDKKILAVCYLDLDGFKPVNDKLGHKAGDQVLIECARRFSECIRDMDTVARLGGDEFVILLQGIEHINGCSKTLDRLLDSIAAPLIIENQVCEISASIGVTLYPQDDGDPDILLRHADQAMYIAKQTGKNRYHFFDAEQDDRLRRFNDTLQRIRHGLNNNEFELFYQPKIYLQQNKIAGAEALIRWRHPQLGLLLPLEFLPAMHQTELEMELGNWVINQALTQQQDWLRRGLNFEVSINISAYHLQDSNFISDLRVKLANFPELPPGVLQIEILETAALKNFEQVRHIIASCHQLGVSFALDDFGTGYSSLTYLRNLPTATIKIDQSFVRDMLEDKDDFAIIQGIVSLANAFDRQIVAEGAESAEHLRILTRLGCHIAQGYGIAKPMSADDFYRWYQINFPAQ